MIKLAAFADEASSSLDGQIAALSRNDIKYIELRGIDGKNIADVTCEEAQIHSKKLSDAGIAVWSIGSPIGKIKITDDLDAHMQKLLHICKLAKIFKTDKIRIFSFFEAYDKKELVFETLSEMVELAAREGISLYHENEKEIYGDTLARVLELMENVKGLKFVYDPVNYIAAGENVALALRTLYDKTDYFHIKDIIAETQEHVPAGHGDAMIPELIDMIKKDKEVILTVEPHLAIFEGYSQFDSSEMKNKFHFNNNDESFDAACCALSKIIIEHGFAKLNRKDA